MTSDQSYEYFTTDLYVMGDNRESQCGIDNQDHINKLTKINLPMVIREIACGLEHTLILTNEGQVYGFGSNLKGQLGIENISVACSPLQISGIKDLNCIKIAAGEYHSCLLTDENQAYQWGDNVQLPKYIRQAQNIKCGLNFTVFQDESLYLYQNQVMQSLQITVEIQDFACSSQNLFYLDYQSKLYLYPDGIILENVQTIFSGYFVSLITEDNKLFYYSQKKLIPVNILQNKIDSSFSKEFGIILDENNNAILINLLKPQQKIEQTNIVFHSISSGVNHIVLIGDIQKGNKAQNQEEEQEEQEQIQEADDDSILEEDGMSPIQTQKTQQDQLNTQQNNTFSFSIRKELQLLHSVKTNNKETQTDEDIYVMIKSENEELRKIQQQQKKNLEIQIQFQKTLQDQINRLTQENQMLKLSQDKNQLLKLIKQKQTNLRNLIDEYYQKQADFFQQKK